MYNINSLPDDGLFTSTSSKKKVSQSANQYLIKGFNQSLSFELQLADYPKYFDITLKHVIMSKM